MRSRSLSGCGQEGAHHSQIPWLSTLLRLLTREALYPEAPDRLWVADNLRENPGRLAYLFRPRHLPRKVVIVYGQPSQDELVLDVEHGDLQPLSYPGLDPTTRTGGGSQYTGGVLEAGSEKKVSCPSMGSGRRPRQLDGGELCVYLEGAGPLSFMAQPVEEQLTIH